MPPDGGRAWLEPPRATDDGDDTGWLTTFSDLVLQLFAFVILLVTLGGAQRALVGQLASPAPAASVRAATAPAPVVRTQAWREPAAAALDGAADDGSARAAIGGASSDAADVAPAAAAPTDAEPARADAAPDGERFAAPSDDQPAAVDEPADAGAAAPPVVAAPLADAADPVAAMTDRLRDAARAAGQGDAVSVTTTGAGVVIRLGEAIAFPSGRAELLPLAGTMLLQVRALAEAMPDLDIEVTGHTDDRPIHTAAFPSNLELSLARAATVARALVGDAALGARVTARGMGEHRPLASNADPEGRARNRRVEVRLLPRS